MGGADPRAPGLYVAALVIMSGVALIASLPPALRAARTDPLTIMRRG
jgi:ABC-type lipoprotein release transport system permease subunit